MLTFFPNVFFSLILSLLSSKNTGQANTGIQAVKNPPVYMLTYDHGGVILWGSDHFRERLRDAISWLDRYPGFKIGLDNEAYTYDYLSNKDPELLKELQGYLKKYPDRFAIGTCTYGQPLSVFISEESNIRQIGYALHANKKYFGYENSIYLMSEHAMHAQIPQIITGFGFRGSIMRTHFMMYGYNPTFNSPYGRWIGVDGSEIPCVPTYAGEGAEFGKTPIDNWILTRYPGPECKTSMKDFRDQFKHINPLLATRADDSGLRKEGLVKELEGKPGYKWVLLEELPRIYGEPAGDFITQPNDFVVRMPWGYCGNEIWNDCRKAEARVLTAERLAAAVGILDGNSMTAELHQSWKHLLLAQHHDIQICGLLGDSRENLQASLDLSGKTLENSLEYVSTKISGNGDRQVVVFNPLSWQRSGWIETDVNYQKGVAKNIRVTCNGIDVPAVILQGERYSDGFIMYGRIAFRADLPGLSINAYSILPVEEAESYAGNIQADNNLLTIRTSQLEIQLHPDGGIMNITDVKTGSPVLRAGDKSPDHGTSARSAFFAGTIDGEECVSKGKWTISGINAQSPWLTATEYGFISDIPYTFIMKIFADKPDIECKVTFDIHGQKIGTVSDNKRDSRSPFIHETKLRFKFLADLEGEVKGVRDLPFSIAETSDKYIQGNYWTAVANETKGMAVFNKGNMCLVREAPHEFSIPLAYAMYYIWGTRMLEGSYSYEFALHPFAGGWTAADIHRKAIAYNFPMIAKSSIGAKPGIADHLNLISISDENVIMSAFYMEDGDVVTRMYQCTGEKANPEIKILFNNNGVTETDFSGNNIGAIGNKVLFTPWKIRTLRIAL